MGSQQIFESNRMTDIRSAFLILLFFVPLFLPSSLLSADNTPVTDNHIKKVNALFEQNGVEKGYVALDQYGRLELKGQYSDEKEVDKAFSLAQTVVGIKWVSPVTPENIKVKEWERSLGSIFSRAKVLKSSVKEDEEPGSVRKKYALVVGVGQFKHGITPLKYAVKDAASFYQFLTDPKRGGFSKKNVTFLTDMKATKDNIVKVLDGIRSMAKEDDLVTIYISSHGTPPDKFGGVHIVTYDTEVKPREKVWHTAITESVFKDFIENLKARRLVLILDTCYSNGAYQSVAGFLPPGGKSLDSGDEEGYGISRKFGKRLLGAKDIVVEEETSESKSGKRGWGKVLMSASGSGEKSWESSTLQNSIFTYYFLEGLDSHKGSLEGAFFHAKPLVNRRVKEEKGQDIEQNPQAMATNKNWDISLTR